MDDILRQLTAGKKPLALILQGGKVRRYHACGAIPAQSVSDHTWRLLAILLHLWPDSSIHLVLVAMYHDVPEGILGDVSAPIKRHPELKGPIDRLDEELMVAMNLSQYAHLSTEEELKLKCADYLECVLYCRQHPSRQAQEVRKRAEEYVLQYSSYLSMEDCRAVGDLLYDFKLGYYDE